MKAKVVYVFAIITMSFIVYITGCATTTAPLQRKMYTDQASWPKTTKDKVYTACVTALHIEGFGVPPLGMSRENGIIITKGVRAFPKGGEGNTTYYSFQILITEVQDNKVMVDVNAKVGGGVSSDFTDDDVECVRIKINNMIAEDLKKFFTRLDILLGKAEYYRDDRLYEW